MGRNEIIGRILGKIVGYTTQGILYSYIARLLNVQSIFIVRIGGNYLIKLVIYTSRNYVRTDFASETIFSDAIDASFFAD